MNLFQWMFSGSKEVDRFPRGEVKEKKNWKKIILLVLAVAIMAYGICSFVLTTYNKDTQDENYVRQENAQTEDCIDSQQSLSSLTNDPGLAPSLDMEPNDTASASTPEPYEPTPDPDPTPYSNGIDPTPVPPTHYEDPSLMKPDCGSDPVALP